MQCGDFDSKLEILCICMAIKPLSVLQPFISFVVEFQMDKTHNMFALMFDPWYKNLEIRKFVGKEATRVVVFEYDKKIVIPLFMKSNKFLNLFGGNNTS